MNDCIWNYQKICEKKNCNNCEQYVPMSDKKLNELIDEWNKLPNHNVPDTSSTRINQSCNNCALRGYCKIKEKVTFNWCNGWTKSKCGISERSDIAVKE